MKLRQPLKIALGILLFLYPVFILLSLTVFHLPMSAVSLGMLIIGVAGYLANTGQGSRWVPAGAGIIALLALVLKSDTVIKFYPICITLVFLGLFGGSLIRKNPIVVHFAEMMDSSIKTHPGRTEIERYCKNVTVIWCVWLVISLTVNVYLVVRGTTVQWTYFNGLICYIVQGMLFAGEFVVRYFVNNRINARYGLPKQGMFSFLKRKESES